ncbi:hypothetical protein KAH43_07075 [Candidatus Bipolaricaulota bacterium]|nr:hypothetical protein [Candidatus Bipolaricaulota bacterium]
MTIKSRRQLLLVLVVVASVSLCAFGVRWSPAELDIAQTPGSEETYQLLLTNDSDERVTLTIYTGDWLRDENGINDFGVPMNGARWEFGQTFSSGDVITIRYSVQLPADGAIGVQGMFRSWSPQTMDAIVGADAISSEAVGQPAPYVSSLWTTITRSVESIDEVGLAQITLTLRVGLDFEGITIEETYSQGTQIISLDAAGGSFDTVNRSNADWINLSHSQVTLDADESREITMTVAMPVDYSGSSWSIIYAKSRVVATGDAAGTQIVSLASVGMKVFVTAPGTEIMTGEVTYVREQSTNPLAISAIFSNTGNVQLVVNSRLQIINQTGEIVRDVHFSEYGRDYFRLLPGSQRTIVIVDEEGIPPLPVGIYQAIFSFDFGGDSELVGVRAFRVR